MGKGRGGQGQRLKQTRRRRRTRQLRRKSRRGHPRVQERRRRQPQCGGANRFLVFYTCFFGPDTNIANKIPAPPSTKYDCFYFTNNRKTFDSLAGTGWNAVFQDIPIKSTDTENAMDSKELKACPHHFSELRGYEYTCYMDSKIKVDEKDVEKMIGLLTDTKVFLLSKHPFLPANVWAEFHEALKQPRYAVQEAMMRGHIERELAKGLSETAENHHQTGFIVRKSGASSEEINEAWWKGIQEAGIECQVSFFFIYQRFKDRIVTVPAYYGFS